ncbi:MAG TPA: aldolase/citrate lyase family protein [Pirellulales bacterium]|jgi:2-dehydro-3-deoxyglucarate aldolase/4-hydroxy-2-oxoheptanedioate aldolase|nr:aldolase/citrate lyase family protein [Pirellulales bacterium]
MKKARTFKQRIVHGPVALGTCISFTDATVTESLCGLLDFVWIDMEHNALSLETVQGHIMATKASETVPLVRVAWNDPVLIKPVLDIGAAGVIVPFVRTADEARRAVEACLYPPAGVRGFGPRRASHYGRLGGPEYCREANESVIVIAQIEHVDAVRNLDEILAVPELTSIVIGPNDLAGSLGLIGQPRHPRVLEAIQTIIATARRKNVPIGLATGYDAVQLVEWASEGVQWLAIANDTSLLLQAATTVAQQVRIKLGQER